MKPYYQDDYCTIYHGDCRDVMPSLPKVDLLLTDPPYGIGNNITYRKNQSSKRANSKNYGEYSWNDDIPGVYAFELMLESAKLKIIWGGELLYTIP